MKSFILFGTLALGTAVNCLHAQNRNTIFFDSLDKVTTYEMHWAQVWTGRYKSVYNKKLNKRTMEITSADELQAEILKTKKRITNKFRLNEPFPFFEVQDINGITFSSDSLRGKVVVINFWFIGCAPCEVEQPVLNELTSLYGKDKVVFLSFARNTKQQLEPFLKDHPVSYVVIPTEKEFIKKTFQINGFPVNIVLDRQGNYFYNSIASGIGIKEILKEAVDQALNQK